MPIPIGGATASATPAAALTSSAAVATQVAGSSTPRLACAATAPPRVPAYGKLISCECTRPTRTHRGCGHRYDSGSGAASEGSRRSAPGHLRRATGARRGGEVHAGRRAGARLARARVDDPSGTLSVRRAANRRAGPPAGGADRAAVAGLRARTLVAGARRPRRFRSLPVRGAARADRPHEPPEPAPPRGAVALAARARPGRYPRRSG